MPTAETKKIADYRSIFGNPFQLSISANFTKSDFLGGFDTSPSPRSVTVKDNPVADPKLHDDKSQSNYLSSNQT